MIRRAWSAVLDLLLARVDAKYGNACNPLDER